MGEFSKIQWTHHTFNPWRGCTKVSAGCQHCYAEAQSKRNPGILGVWGDDGARVVASERYWAEALRWNAEALAAKERRRVFCASMADVFEEWPQPMKTDKRGVEPITMDDARVRLFDLIRRTPQLDWLLLTKRPENILPIMRRCNADPRAHNLWIGVSVENQLAAEERIPRLAAVPAFVRFVSYEPALTAVNFRRLRDDEVGAHWDALSPSEGRAVDWIIVGGESGREARSCELDWIRSTIAQCRAAGVPVFVKQLGAHPRGLLGGTEALGGYRPRHPKGGEPDEWPVDLRVREFPETRHA